MNAEPRRVTVNVLVTRTLEIDEPNWCVDPHDTTHFKPDITHNGPEIAAEFDTPHGTIAYLQAWITQAPYGILQPEPLPLIAIDLGEGAADLEPEDVRRLTAVTRDHLDRLDRLADEADRLRGGSQ